VSADEVSADEVWAALDEIPDPEIPVISLGELKNPLCPHVLVPPPAVP